MYDGGEMPLDLVSSRSTSMKLARTCGMLLMLASAAGCASHRGASGGGATASRGMYKVGAPYTIDGVTYTPMEEFQHVETGIASWYGPGFHGKSTANGETYDQSDHTAAHRTLQMPSVVRVTNLDNGRSTVVRVNDRGPYARGRVLDVSRAAAEELDMTHTGTARVRIEQLSMESQAMKDIALNGGGASEQRDALDKFIAGRRGPPPVAATAQATSPATSVTVPATPPPPVLPNPRSPAVTPLVASGSAGQGSGQQQPTVATIASARTSVRRVLCPDWCLLDRRQCRKAARPFDQLRLVRDIPGLGGRQRGLSCAPGALYDVGCRRHCRRPAEAFRVW